jgi:hypothetical protein
MKYIIVLYSTVVSIVHDSSKTLVYIGLKFFFAIMGGACPLSHNTVAHQGAALVLTTSSHKSPHKRRDHHSIMNSDNMNTHLNDNDVLLGSGTPFVEFIGNRRFRRLVAERKERYTRAP